MGAQLLWNALDSRLLPEVVTGPVIAEERLIPLAVPIKEGRGLLTVGRDAVHHDVDGTAWMCVHGERHAGRSSPVSIGFPERQRVS